MKWTPLLEAEIDAAYRATYGLLDLVDDDALDWAPATGTNWMTTGQLLAHLGTACGFCIRGFVTGDWDMPEGQDLSDLSDEDLLPPADKMPSAATVAAAREALRADHELSLAMVREAGEERLETEQATAPWNPNPKSLGHHCLDMVGHLISHKSQLFYYLKLQGKPVHTGLLWGMSDDE